VEYEFSVENNNVFMKMELGVKFIAILIFNKLNVFQRNHFQDFCI